jgi:hypothetical protein
MASTLHSALEPWQRTVLPRSTVLALSFCVLIAAPAACAIWLQLPLAYPADNDRISFPLFLLLFGLYIYQSQWCGFLWLGMRTPILSPVKLAVASAGLTAIPLAAVVLFRPLLEDHYQVMIAASSILGFISLTLFSLWYGWFTSHKNLASFTSATNVEGAQSGCKELSVFAQPLLDVRGEPADEKVSDSCSGQFRSFQDSIVPKSMSFDAMIYNFRASSSIYCFNILCYLWCWVFTYLFINYLHAHRQQSTFTVSWVIIFGVLFSSSFAPFRIGTGFIVKRIVAADDKVTYMSRELLRYSANGLEAVGLVFIELIFFVFYRSLFTELHSFATFLLLEVTKYVMEDVFRFLLPLSRSWYHFRLKHLAPIPVVGRLFFRSATDSFEKEVHRTALQYGMHVIASGGSGVCYLLMLLVLRHNQNSQFYPYSGMANDEFQLLVGFYSISFVFLLINFFAMHRFLSWKHGVDMLSVTWFPFVKNRVALCSLLLLAPHVMQDVYLAMIRFKE